MQEPSYIGFHLNDDEDRIRVSSSLSLVICRTILVNNDATVKDLSQSLNLPRNQGSDLLSTFISRSCIISGSRSQKLQQKRTQHTTPREHPPSENIAQERSVLCSTANIVLEELGKAWLQVKLYVCSFASNFVAHKLSKTLAEAREGDLAV